MPTSQRPLATERTTISSLIVTLLQLTVFFIPLAVLPVTFERFDFVKGHLLWFFAGAVTLLWLVQTFIIQKRLTYRKTPLDIPIIIMLAVWGVAALAGVDWFSSLFGSYGRFADAYLTTVSCAALYFVAVNTLNERQTVRLQRTFLLAAGLGLAVSMAAMSGLTARLVNAAGRLAFMGAPVFSPLGGSVDAPAVVAAAVVVFVVARFSCSTGGLRRERSARAAYAVLGILALAVLWRTNVAYAWVAVMAATALLFGLLLYVTYASRQATTHLSVNVAPAFAGFIVAAVFLFAFGNSGVPWQPLPREVALPVREARAVAWESFKQNPLFGSGPGTYSYAFAAHRPAALNTSQFWQFRFDKTPLYLLELVTTVGLLGLLSYLAVVGVFLLVSVVFIRNLFRAPGEHGTMALACSFMALTLFVGQALLPVNTTLVFAFWVALTLGMLHWRVAFADVFSDTVVALTRYREFASLQKAVVASAVALFVVLVVLQARQVLADERYTTFRLTGELEALTRAIELNGRRVSYHLALARHYLGQARDDIARFNSPDAGTLPAARREVLQNNVQQAINAAQVATEVAPSAVAAWELLGAIYRDVRQIAVGSVEPAITAFERARGLEPTNPVILTELGNLYAARSRTSDAVNVFERAVVLKPDYAPAHIGLAKTYEELGQPDKALVVLEEVLRQSPAAAEVVYETGRLYYNQNNLNKAVERFRSAAALRTGYANAIYSLGLAYQKQGDKKSALEEFQKVLELNPENMAIQKIIEELTDVNTDEVEE